MVSGVTISQRTRGVAIGVEVSSIELQQRKDAFVLIVGIDRLAKAYIGAVAVIAVLERDGGRPASACPVPGGDEDITEVWQQLPTVGILKG